MRGGAGQRNTWVARALDAGYTTAGYGTELAHFLDCIVGLATPAPSLTDELVVYKALDDLYQQITLTSTRPTAREPDDWPAADRFG